MASMAFRERVNQGNQQAAGFSHKPIVNAAKIPSLPSVVPSLSAREKDVKADAAKLVSRAKRIRVAQEQIRTASKENVVVPVRERPDDVKDIYSDDFDNEALVVAYVEHIYSYLHERQKVCVKADYLEEMSVNSRMRWILMDWLVSVAHKFDMGQDSLFLAVHIVDRFLSTPTLDVTKDDLQLMGVTAMFIAGKFEEVYPPELEDYVYIADNSCNKEQILEAEMMMVNALNFDFSRPTPVHFLRRCCKTANADNEEYVAAKYIAELSILNVAFVEIVPSLIAAAAVYLTLQVFNAQEDCELLPWTKELEYYSGHKFDEVVPVASKLLDLIKAQPNAKYQCSYKKYSTSRLYGVAQTVTQAAETLIFP